jgi:hypothetical protein
MNRSFRNNPLVAVLLVFSAAAAACNGSGPLAPSGPAAGGAAAAPADDSGAARITALATPSIAAPRPLLPANNSLVTNQSQPVTLVVTNALVTKAGGITYTFEVATDVGFTSKVQTKDGVAEGTGGQTSVRLDSLAPARDYYWRARAQAGGTTGVFGAIYRFTIGAAVILNAPVPVTPLSGATTPGWPIFTVNNAPKSGPAGPLSYRFEVATSAAFTNIILAQVVAEGSNRTSFVPPANLAAPSQTSLFWRATAIDQINSVSSPPSATQSFTYTSPTPQSVLAAQLGVTIWPGAQPTGTNGHAFMGPGWAVQNLRSFDGVVFQNPPVEALQLFDLLDRGFDPDGAIGWMKTNGYPTQAVWYPDPKAIGLPFQYMALVNGAWELVLRFGA